MDVNAAAERMQKDCQKEIKLECMFKNKPGKLTFFW